GGGAVGGGGRAPHRSARQTVQAGGSWDLPGSTAGLAGKLRFQTDGNGRWNERRYVAADGCDLPHQCGADRAGDRRGRQKNRLHGGRRGGRGGFRAGISISEAKSVTVRSPGISSVAPSRWAAATTRSPKVMQAKSQPLARASAPQVSSIMARRSSASNKGALPGWVPIAS